MSRRAQPEPLPPRYKLDPIGEASVSIGHCAPQLVPLLMVSQLGEALVRLPAGDRWVPASWWTEESAR